jgi:hypothetical protein
MHSGMNERKHFQYLSKHRRHHIHPFIHNTHDDESFEPSYPPVQSRVVCMLISAHALGVMVDNELPMLLIELDGK